MKIKKNKFLLGAMLSIVSLGIVGSVSGTYAWYSYNTKSPFVYSGIATGDSENLQIKLIEEGAEYAQFISEDDFKDNSDANGYAKKYLKPVTFSDNVSKNGQVGTDSTKPKLQDSSFKGILSYGDPNYTTSGLSTKNGNASNKSWLRTNIALRCVNPADTDEYFAQNVYISDIQMECTTKDEDTKEILDISDAVRIFIGDKGGQSGYIIAPGIDSPDDSEVGSLELFGELDLDGDGNPDKGVYEKKQDGSGKYLRQDNYNGAFVDSETEEVKTITYGVNEKYEHFYYRDAAITTFESGKVKGDAGICVGTTQADNESGTDVLELKICIYLQGWAASMVDKNINASFKLGLTFQVETL